jgi:hypothetical protein
MLITGRKAVSVVDISPVIGIHAGNGAILNPRAKGLIFI